MNRMEEYEDLMKELEQPVHQLEQTFDRAKRRAKRRSRVMRPLVSLAATFAIFVGLVNYCTPVAIAFNQIPIIRELAEAVTFSRSLTNAVIHDYMQPIAQTRTDGDVTATVEYVIVDQKQVIVFFRLDSEVYTDIKAFPYTPLKKGNGFVFCNYELNDWDVPNGELESITIEYSNSDVPDTMHLQLDILDMASTPQETISQLVMERGSNAIVENGISDDTEYIAQLDFILKFDPQFTETNAKIFPINKTFTLHGNEITFTTMEVYPTHMRLNAKDSPNNAEWLNTLDFYVLADDGTKYEPPFPGTTADLLRNSETMTSSMSFYAESPYFSESKKYEIVIQAAEWTNKDTEEKYEIPVEEPITIRVK